jgi:predicted enzyme related to lactoylglutathione lyase
MEVLSSRVLMAPSDLVRSRRWYEDVLGLRVYREFGHGGVVSGVVYFLGGGYLELSMAGSPAGPGITLWLQVQDLGAEWRRLQAAGATFVKPPTRRPWGLIEGWVCDPDDTRLVLVEVPEDHPIRRRLDT